MAWKRMMLMSAHKTITQKTWETWGTIWHLPSICWSFPLSGALPEIYCSAKVSERRNVGDRAAQKPLPPVNQPLKKWQGDGRAWDETFVTTGHLFEVHYTSVISGTIWCIRDEKEALWKTCFLHNPKQEICFSLQHSCYTLRTNQMTDKVSRNDGEFRLNGVNFDMWFTLTAISWKS